MARFSGCSTTSGLPCISTLRIRSTASSQSCGSAWRSWVETRMVAPSVASSRKRRVILAAEMHAAGADEVVIADTIGSAFPGEVRLRMIELSDVVSLDRLAIHLHDTRGMGVANAWAALDAGVRRFDASVGGIGGCPFAPGAAGNVATEDLVLLAENSGFETGIVPDALLDAVEYAQSLLGRPLGGHSARWLMRQRAEASRR